jgi:hypothetical protein
LFKGNAPTYGTTPFKDSSITIGTYYDNTTGWVPQPTNLTLTMTAIPPPFELMPDKRTSHFG